MDCNKLFNIVLLFFSDSDIQQSSQSIEVHVFSQKTQILWQRKTIWPKKKYLILQWKHCPDIFQCWIHRLVCFGKVYLISSMSYYSKMITEAFQVILKYDAPGQEDIVMYVRSCHLHLMILRKNLTQWLKHWMKLINSKMTG
jgi:hypothetical protein